MTVIIPGSASKNLATQLAKTLKKPLIPIEIKRFPDTELYIRITEDLTGKHAVIIQTTHPDPHIMELFFIQAAAKEAGAKTITTITPYYGYGRQDHSFKTGEAISAKTLAELISVHSNTFITVDPHKKAILNFFTIPTQHCTAIPEIATYLCTNRDIDLVLAPDKGALISAQETAELIGCDHDFMEKTRINGTTVEIKPKNLDVNNKNIAIIDDIISTGGTMAKSIKELKKQGAKQVTVACTHGLFVGDAIKKLQNAGCTDIIATDTIQSSYSKVSVAPSLAKLLK